MKANNWLPGTMVVASACALAACGSGSSSGPEVQTGVFIDSPVAGIEYETDSQTGLTDELGQFNYLDGEVVRFRLGNVTIGEAVAGTQVFVKDLFPEEEEFSRAQVNLARLMLLLDADDLPANGIQIDQATRDAALNWQLDFSSEAFSESLVPVAEALGKDTNSLLSSERFAGQHLLGSLSCEYGGIYLDGTGGTNGGDIVFAVTDLGMIHGFSAGQEAPAVTAVRFPAGSAEFDAGADPYEFSIREAFFAIRSDPNIDFSDAIDLGGVAGFFSNPAFVPVSLNFSRFDLVFGDPAEAGDWTFAGDIIDQVLAGNWATEGDNGSFSAARLLAKGADDLRLLAPYEIDTQDSETKTYGLVDVIIDANGNAAGNAVGFSMGELRELTGEVVEDESGGRLLTLSDASDFSVTYQFITESRAVRQELGQFLNAGEPVDMSVTSSLLEYRSSREADVGENTVSEADVGGVYALAVVVPLEGLLTPGGGLLCQ